MKKILVIVAISLFFSNLVYSNNKDKLREEVFLVCTGETSSHRRSFNPVKFVDEYKVTLNTLKQNELTNSLRNNNYIDYYKKNPIRNVELINSNRPTHRIVLVSQDLLKFEGGNVNGKLRPKNMNKEFYKVLYPKGIGKVYYSELWFESNILNFKYKFIHNTSPPEIQTNMTKISLITGAYTSNISLEHTEGRFKNEKLTYNFLGTCNVNSLISSLEDLKRESKGSFSYNYLFFLLIIIGITIFVYKQGSKKKRKTK